MGDPKKPKKKYSTPRHPWEKERIDEEKLLSKEYAFSNKKDVWKVSSKLTGFKGQLKKLIASTGDQAEKEKAALFLKLIDLGLVKENAQPDDILSLSIKDLAERRLCTLVFRKGLARSTQQARQLIVHKHIMVGGHMVNSPSYMVKVKEEDTISFAPSSSLANPDHPERATENKSAKAEVEKNAKGS